MTNDARTWLRANGHEGAADVIDEIMAEWKARDARTRRNWWDALAGTKAGAPCVVEGRKFPILAEARARKGWAAVSTTPSSYEDARPDGDARRVAEDAPSAHPEPAPAVTSDSRPSRRRRNDRGSRSRRDARQSEQALTVRNFAHLENVVVPLNDLVVLVGPQATGKSLILQILKLVIDRHRIVRSLRQHGFTWSSAGEFSALYFGGGFDRSWRDDTQVEYGNKSYAIDDLAGARAYAGEDAVFYIPAHRTLAIAEGWPRPFAQYQVETPYVARRFSEELLTSLNQGLVGKGRIFPHDRRLKDALRRLIDDAVFHRASLRLDTQGMRKQFVLEYGAPGASDDLTEAMARLPFMAWTAGQREFTPLLLGLYHLLPAGGAPKKKEIQWAVIEEPEMGLHPKAIVAVMAVVLDLLARGYKVALSTHSPTVLEVVWGMRWLRDRPDGAAALCGMMGLPHREKAVLRTAAQALEKSHAVVYLDHNDAGKVVSSDITGLDPASAAKDERVWGGLTSFSVDVANAITSGVR